MSLLSRLSRLLNRWRHSQLIVAVATGTGLALGIRIAGVALGYLTEVVLARLLGPSEYGVYSLVIAWVTLIALFPLLGFHHAVGRFIPQYIEQKECGRLYGIVRGSLLASLAASIALAAVGFVILYIVDTYFGVPYITAWYMGMLLLPVLGLLRLTRSVAVALRRVVLAFAPPLVRQPLLLIGFVFLLVRLGAPLSGVAALLAAVAAGLLVLGGQLGFLKHEGLPLADTGGTLYDWRVWLAVGLPLILFDTFSMALRQADLMMIGVLMTPADAGIYGAALKTTGQTIFLLVSVTAVVAPMLATLWTRQDRKGMQRVLYMAAHLSFWPALAFVLVLSLFSDFILGLFGEAFVAAQWPMIILGIGQLFNAGTGVVVSLMIVSGHHMTVTRVFGISALIYIILLFFGIQAFGLIGAAMATALTMALWNIWLNRLAWRDMKLHTSIVEAMIALVRRKRQT